jgi:ferredoxin
MSRVKAFRPLFDDNNGTHDWSKDEQKCQVADHGEKKHKHFMLCGRCGIRRYGAFAEPGAHHYFYYDHKDGFRHEYLPPCLGKAGEGAVVRQAIICKKCGRLIIEAGMACASGCEEGAIAITACFLPGF